VRPSAPYYHAVSRPQAVEREGAHRAITMSEIVDVPILLVHVSSADAVEQIHWAHGRGLKILAETCPQYLVLTAEHLRAPGFEGAKYICSPPIRERSNQEHLWKALAADDLQAVSTDHCPFDFHGQKEMGRGDFRKVPNGLPGVEHRVDLLHDGGVVGGHLTPNRWVEVISTAPARMFGLPQKGVVAAGADADLVIYDPNRTHTLSAATHHMDVDYSCYEGRSVQGGADVVLSRGKVIVEGDAWLGAAGDGRFLKRERSEYLR